MSKGQLDGAELTSYGLSLVDPTVRVLELPGMFDSIEETDYVADKSWPFLQKKLSKLSLVLAAREELGSIQFYSQGSIDTLSAFTKANIWIDPNDAVFRDLYAQLGISGVALQRSKVDAALGKPTIDTCYATPAAMQALQSSSTVRYRSSLPLGYRVAAIAITSAAFNGLSSADQLVVLQLMKKAASQQRTAMRRENDAAQKAMNSGGLTSSTASTQLAATFDTAAQMTWQNLAGTLYSQQEPADVVQYRALYRTKHSGAAGTAPP